MPKPLRLYSAVGLHVGQDQKQLRARVADELQTNLEKYEPFLELKSQQTPAQYIKQVRHNSEWAGNAEITALMHILQRPIMVVRPGENPQLRAQNPTEAERRYFDKGVPILVKYNGVNHYNALILIAPNSPPASLQNQKNTLEVKLTQLIKDEKLSHANAHVFIRSEQDFSCVYVKNGIPQPAEKIMLKPRGQFERLELLIDQLDKRLNKSGYLLLKPEAIQIITSNTNCTPSPLAMPFSSSITILENGEFKKPKDKKLGAGGQGDIYQDQWQDEVVAVKHLHLSEVPIDAVRRQIQHLSEAKTNQCDYLMQIKAFCLTPPCLVLEYMPGSNLTTFLKTHPTIIWLRRYRLAHDIIQGIAYLHTQGLLHRDLKSDNIMVMERPRLRTKLCDFDSLKKIQVGETGLTQFKVTPLYLDPEYSQMMYGSSESSMSYGWYHDIYSLGCVLYEIATGNSPPSVHMHQGAIYTQKDVPLVDIIPKDKECPQEFTQLIRDCWRLPASSRPRAAELAQRMVDLLKAEQHKLANTPDEKGRSPLMQAISRGKTGKVATLLACKANVNYVDSHGWTPLFWAVKRGKQVSRMTQLLLEAKADPTIAGPIQNELIKACENGSLEKVKTAIEKGALVDLPNVQGKNPLYCAVYGMNPEVVNYVIGQKRGEITPTSWQDCEEHNKKHYGQTFLNQKFKPKTFDEWYALLTQIASNEFLTGYHLRVVHNFYGKKGSGDFRAWLSKIRQGSHNGMVRRVGAGVTGVGAAVVGLG